MGAVIAAAVARAERDVVDSLRDVRAFDVASAVDLPDLRPIARRRLHRLIGVGAVVDTGRGYYLDERAYAAYGARRHRRVLVVLVLVILVVAALIFRDGLRAAAVS